MAWRAAHRLDHFGVVDATLAQPLHEALAGALRRHADTVNVDRTHSRIPFVRRRQYSTRLLPPAPRPPPVPAARRSQMRPVQLPNRSTRSVSSQLQLKARGTNTSGRRSWVRPHAPARAASAAHAPQHLLFERCHGGHRHRATGRAPTADLRESLHHRGDASNSPCAHAPRAPD